MSSSNERKFPFMALTVNMVLAGCSTFVATEFAGVSKPSVNNWIRTADESGFDALKATRQSGRPSKLLDDQIRLIDTALQENPADYGLKIWDGQVCLLISATHLVCKYVFVSAGACSVNLVIHIFGHILIQTKGMKTRKNAKPLKRTKSDNQTTVTSG